MTCIRFEGKEYEILDQKDYPFNLYNVSTISRLRRQIANKQTSVNNYKEMIKYKKKELLDLLNKLVKDYEKL